MSRDEYHSPPASATDRRAGESVRVPRFLSRDLGLTREGVEALRGSPESADWWNVKFRIGRAPFDAKYCAVWRARSSSRSRPRRER